MRRRAYVLLAGWVGLGVAAMAVGWPLAAQENEPVREPERRESPDAERRERAERWEREHHDREPIGDRWISCRSCHTQVHTDTGPGGRHREHQEEIERENRHERERPDVDRRVEMISHAAELLAEAGEHEIARLLHQQIEQMHHHGGGERGEDEHRERAGNAPVTVEHLREMEELLEQLHERLEHLSRRVDELAGDRDEDDERERERPGDRGERERERPGERDGAERETQPRKGNPTDEAKEKPAERDE